MRTLRNKIRQNNSEMSKEVIQGQRKKISEENKQTNKISKQRLVAQSHRITSGGGSCQLLEHYGSPDVN
jgi:hypothetical protein